MCLFVVCCEGLFVCVQARTVPSICGLLHVRSTEDVAQSVSPTHQNARGRHLPTELDHGQRHDLPQQGQVWLQNVGLFIMVPWKEGHWGDVIYIWRRPAKALLDDLHLVHTLQTIILLFCHTPSVWHMALGTPSVAQLFFFFLNKGKWWPYNLSEKLEQIICCLDKYYYIYYRCFL